MSRQVEPYTRRRFLDALLWIAPATVAVLRANVLLRTSSGPKLEIPPPVDVAVFPEKVESITVDEPELVVSNPAPVRARLPDTTTLESVSCSELKIPPPSNAWLAPVIVKPEIDTTL